MIQKVTIQSSFYGWLERSRIVLALYKFYEKTTDQLLSQSVSLTANFIFPISGWHNSQCPSRLLLDGKKDYSGSKMICHIYSAVGFNMTCHANSSKSVFVGWDSELESADKRKTERPHVCAKTTSRSFFKVVKCLNPFSSMKCLTAWCSTPWLLVCSSLSKAQLSPKISPTYCASWCFQKSSKGLSHHCKLRLPALNLTPNR